MQTGRSRVAQTQIRSQQTPHPPDVVLDRTAKLGPARSLLQKQTDLVNRRLRILLPPQQLSALQLGKEDQVGTAGQVAIHLLQVPPLQGVQNHRGVGTGHHHA